MLWGIAHIVRTKAVVSGFGSISQDNKRIITMEWIAEVLMLCFIGLLVLFVTLWGEARNQTLMIIYMASFAMLVIMAALTSVAGARHRSCR